MEKNSEFGSRLRALVIAKGGTDADLECLLSEAGAADFDCIAASVVGLADFIEIDVDYGASEEDYAERFRALIAKGAYIEYCNLDVTPEHFPSGGRRGVHRRRIQLFQPDVIEGKGYWTNQNVRDGFVTNAAGRVQIHPYDLLVLCAKHLRLGLDFPLVASFGVSWQDGVGTHRVLCVDRYGDRRALALYYLEHVRCYKDCRFPVASEVPQP